MFVIMVSLSKSKSFGQSYCNSKYAHSIFDRVESSKQPKSSIGNWLST